MAGSSWYTAILDANVLYPQLLRDTLLRLAVERLYHARWSATIHDEWTRNLAKDRPGMATRLPAVVALMNASVPDCLVHAGCWGFAEPTKCLFYIYIRHLANPVNLQTSSVVAKPFFLTSKN